jgi:GT2 family glycosyltransferase
MISVIIPSKNRYQILLQLLQDLACQTKVPEEIIVVDQSDQPYENLDCTHIIDVGNGPCRARNLGVKNSHGDILVFLDDDIRIENDFLEKLCKPIINQRYDVVSGAICDEMGHYLRSDRFYWRNMEKMIFRAMTISPSNPEPGLSLCMPGGCSAITRSAFYKVGGFDTYFDPDGAGEDRELGIRLFLNGFPIYYNPSAKIKHLASNYGGRRDIQKASIDILGANIAYIIGLYFTRNNLKQYIREYLKSTFLSGLTIKPISWYRSTRRYIYAKKYVKHIYTSVEAHQPGRDFISDV